MDKTALITGASSGIGKATAAKLAQDGFNLILTSRSESSLIEVKGAIQNHDITIETVAGDLSTVKGINTLIHEIKDNKIDVLINIAGVWHGDGEVYADKDYSTYSQDVINETMNVGLLAPMLISQAFIHTMPDKSKIVNVSGTFQDGAKGWLPYYVSKRALEDFTVGLAEELKDNDIQVNCVSPSDTATEAYKEYFPEYAKDAMKPEDVANQIAYLCSDSTDNTTGKIFVMKKGSTPSEDFHL